MATSAAHVLSPLGGNSTQSLASKTSRIDALYRTTFFRRQAALMGLEQSQDIVMDCTVLLV